jgi:hypothetical protein
MAHKRTVDHLPDGTPYARVNKRLAILITRGVGTMTCAYVFTFIALISLPSILRTGNVIDIVAWVAQTFMQLVLLSVIIVGQNIQAAASDARAAKEFADTELIVDRLDTRTQGGLAEILDAIRER